MSAFDGVSPALYTIILTYGLLRETVYVSNVCFFNCKIYLSRHVKIALTVICSMQFRIKASSQ